MNQLLHILSSANSEELLTARLAEHLRTTFGCDAVEILTLDKSGQLVLKASTSAPDQVGRVRFSGKRGVAGKALEANHPEFVEKDLASHPCAQPFPGFNENQFKSGAFLPVWIEGAAYGVCILRKTDDHAWSVLEQQAMVTNAEEALLALHCYQKVYHLGEQADRLRPLSEVATMIAGSPYLEEILQLLVSMTAEQFGYKVCTVRLLDETSDELVLRATQARMPEYQRKRALRVGESIAGRAVVEKRSIVVTDVLNEEAYVGHDLAEQQGLRSMVCVPLAIHNKAIGVLTCYTDELREFSEGEILSLETIAAQAAFSIERAKLQVRATLMQEMHHRVKNNLQQIVSLLRLQLRHRHYSSIEDAITDSVHRILAIAAVHDLLSRDDLDRVGLKTVAETLVHHAQQSIVLPDSNISFDLRGDDIRMTMTQATQVALVLNELIQNAIEHGFHGELSGEIHITFERKEQDVSLWVANNGEPLPKGFDLHKNAHLGLQIVSNLARGLGGSFSMFDSFGWAVAEVKFPQRGSD